MAVEIGYFRPEDGPACEAIGGDVFAGLNIPYFLEEKYGIPGYGSRMNAYWTRGLFEGHPDHFLVAREGDEVVGFAGLAPDPASGTGSLAHIGVRRQSQGRGIGRRLVERGLEHCRRLGLGAAWIAYDEGNERAGGLYRRLGFVDFAVDVFLDAPMPAAGGAGEAAAARLSLPEMLERLPADRPVFVEEEVARLHRLEAEPQEIRRAALRTRLGAGLRLYAPPDGADPSFALVGREAGGPVLRFSHLWMARPAEAPSFIGGVLAREAAIGGEPALRACYADVYPPRDDAIAALEAAGFGVIHRLHCLSQRL